MAVCSVCINKKIKKAGGRYVVLEINRCDSFLLVSSSFSQRQPYTPSFHTALEMLHSRVCNRMNTSFCWAERECEPK
jgi:hypothetical protein